MNVYIGEPIVVSDMQGPCAAGFHIPTNTEWQDVLNIFIGFGIGYSNYKIYLKLPLGGYRSYTDGELYSTGDAGRYWSSVEYESGYIYCLNATDSTTEVDWHYRLAGYGCSIRPFKDKPSVPDSTRTTIYQGGGNAGVYHNSDLGLISLSSDGTTWITIADKNLGATTVWNNGDTLSESNCGKYYQRGNNYGFDGIGGSNPTTSSTQVNAGSYGPGNYYESSTFIIGNSGIPYTGTYSNLRGGVSQGTTTVSQELQNAYIGEYKGWKPGANTIAYYPLETDTNDYSSNSHNGTNYGTTFTTLSSGKKVGVFNGSAYIQIPDAQDMRGGNQWTMSVYLKKSSGGSVALDPFSKGVDSSYSSIVWRIGLRSDIINNIGYGINPSNNTNKPSYIWASALDGNWHHLIWTFNNGIYKLYGDGNLLQTQDFSSNSYSFSSTGNSYISGSRNPYESQVTYKRVGNMSEMIIENKVRTADEIQDYYNLTKSNYGL